MRKIRVAWKSIDPEIIRRYTREYYKIWHDYPSVRDIFYAFIDQLWPNTNTRYKKLSEWLRDRRLDGSIDWKTIRDGSDRKKYKGDYSFKDPENYVQGKLDDFKESPEFYHLPRWYGQPNFVVVVSEKEADVPPLRSICSPLGVDVQYTKGYSGWRGLFELAEEIKTLLNTKIEKGIILASGDFDPSGEDIVRFFEDAMVNDLGIPVYVEKVCVTLEQIERFKLPHRPQDSGEIEKLMRDSRFKKWPYGLYRVETAAFRILQPHIFIETLQNAINKHFDEKIYEETRELENEYKKDVEKLIQEFMEKIESD